MTTTDIIKLIRTTRTTQGLKQTDMAEMLNMNLLAYQRLERQNPTSRVQDVANI